MLIAAVIPATDADDALTAAKCSFDRLVGFGTREPVFESYVTFDQDVPPSVAGRDGDDLPVVTPARSERGAALLERQWAETLTSFVDNLERTQAAMESHSIGAIMRDVEGVRSAFRAVGATEGPDIYLYDEYGLGIRHRDRLEAVLGQDDQVWVVPAEVTY
jgi:hypothetical protein